MVRQRELSALTWAAAVAVVPVAALHFFGREKVFIPNTVHFAAVAGPPSPVGPP